jgi:hypothetical protein
MTARRDIRAALNYLALGGPMVAVLLAVGPLKPSEVILAAVIAGGGVVYAHGPVSARARASGRRALRWTAGALQGAALLAPLALGGLYERSIALGLAANAIVLAGVIAGLGRLRVPG